MTISRSHLHEGTSPDLAAHCTKGPPRSAVPLDRSTTLPHSTVALHCSTVAQPQHDTLLYTACIRNCDCSPSPNPKPCPQAQSVALKCSAKCNHNRAAITAPTVPSIATTAVLHSPTTPTVPLPQCPQSPTRPCSDRALDCHPNRRTCSATCSSKTQPGNEV